MEQSLGRNSIIGTTINDPDLLPEHLAADEKHSRLKGSKIYIATTVGENCILGASVSEDAGEKGLKESYGIFRDEALDLNPKYQPKSVNTDGWNATISQRIRRLCEWANAVKDLPDVISQPIMKLKKNLSSYANAYDLPGCHRTSNMVNRLMQRMDRHLFSTFYFHGNLQSAELSIRGWALIQNFAPCNPTTV